MKAIFVFITICFLWLIHAANASELGIASWYGSEAAGKRTASGEIFHPEGYSCASWRYPFGTWLLVRNVGNGKSVVVRCNDRGPARRLRRAIDLSEAAFKQISDPRLGLAHVTIKRL